MDMTTVEAVKVEVTIDCYWPLLSSATVDGREIRPIDLLCMKPYETKDGRLPILTG